MNIYILYIICVGLIHCDFTIALYTLYTCFWKCKSFGHLHGFMRLPWIFRKVVEMILTAQYYGTLRCSTRWNARASSVSWCTVAKYTTKNGVKATVCWLVIFLTIFCGLLHLQPMLWGVVLCDLRLATCVCLGYAAESSQRPHGSRRKVFLTPFGPVNSLELVRRSMARAFRMLEEEPWNFDGWATTRWFREDIHNIIILDKFSYVLRLKLKDIQYLFGVKVTGISYQHNRGWPVTAQCLYPGGGWCHGFAMAWLAAPRSVMDFPWKHVRTKWHNLAVTWRSSNAWLRYVSWEGMISGYGDNSSQISVGTILYNHAKHA